MTGLRRCLAGLVCGSGSVLAQQSAPVSVMPSAAVAPQPIQKMPFTPVLDVTSIDRTIDPCVDFYKYSCGGWIKNNPIPADQAAWSVYGKLADENQQFLWGILKADTAAANRTPVQQKIGDAFAACMDTAAIDKRGLDPLLRSPASSAAILINSSTRCPLPNLQRSIRTSIGTPCSSNTVLPHSRL